MVLRASGKSEEVVTDQRKLGDLVRSSPSALRAPNFWERVHGTVPPVTMRAVDAQIGGKPTVVGGIVSMGVMAVAGQGGKGKKNQHGAQMPKFATGEFARQL